MEQTVKQTDLFKVAELELIYRTYVRPSAQPQILSSSIAYKILVEKWDPNQIELMEEFKMMILNRRKRLMGIIPISKGSDSQIIVAPKFIFAAAMIKNASSIIICHNHPSGEVDPSKADENLTLKLKTIGDLHDIPLDDHLIISKEKYFSFAEEGLL